MVLFFSSKSGVEVRAFTGSSLFSMEAFEDCTVELVVFPRSCGKTLPNFDFFLPKFHFILPNFYFWSP